MLQAANSQSLAGGLNGLSSTLQAIRNAGMEPLGAYSSQEEAEESGGFVIWEIQGIRVAVVAFTKGMDGAGLPAGSENRINLLYTDYNSAYQKVDTEGITRTLKNIAACKPDVTIAMLHWGSEFNNQISSTQKKITELMLNNGVDAIIGTHSHYVQKVEYDESKGTVVAYSLGDLLGNADKAGTDYSVLLDLEITKDGATGKTKITSLDYTPVFICDETASGGSMRLLRIREAIAAYENNAIGCVSKETYTQMVSVLSKIESRMPVKK
jgi:poly-gamma-glutamate synthesis protein (capsule biosynthesis protein)